MSEDQFTRLFKHMDSRFESIDKKLENMATKDDIEQILSVIDGYASNLDMYAQEMAAMDHKIMRLERYIQVLAKKAGVDLDAIHV